MYRSLGAGIGISIASIQKSNPDCDLVPDSDIKFQISDFKFK